MKYIKLIIITFFCFPLSLLADTGNVMVECPNNVKKGQEVECSISAYSLYEVSAVEYEFILPDGVKKIRTVVDESWLGTEEDNLFLLYTDENKKGDFKIGTLVLKVDNDFDKLIVATKKLIYTDETFQEHIIVDDDVNKVENQEELKTHKKNNYIKYGIIVLIIGIFVISIIILKKRSENDEK